MSVEPNEQPQIRPPSPPSRAERIQSGKNKAIVALVLGIIAIGLPIPILDLACGIIGLVLAIRARNYGFRGGIRTAAFVLSIIGISIASIRTLRGGAWIWTRLWEWIWTPLW